MKMKMAGKMKVKGNTTFNALERLESTPSRCHHTGLFLGSIIIGFISISYFVVP
jgi:hypothetical protein